MFFGKFRKRRLLAYTVAVVAVLLTVMIRWALQPVLGDMAPLILLLIPVAFAAWFGGFWPGLLATFLAGYLGITLFAPLSVSGIQHGLAFHFLARGVPFLIVGAFFSFLAARLEQARRDADHQRRAAELQGSATQQLFESVKDFSIFSTDLAGIINSWSPGAERVFGWPTDEALGMHFSTVFTPEDRAAGAPATELETARTKGRASDDRWHLRKDNTRFFASGVVTPLKDESGSIVGFTKVARDVTAQQQIKLQLAEAKRRSEAALSAAEMGTFEWHVAADRVYGDANFSRIFGVTVDDEHPQPIGAFLNRIHPDDRARASKAIGHTLEAGGDYEVECRLLVTDLNPSDEPERWILARGRRDVTADGLIRFPGSVVDITERKASEHARLITEERYHTLFESIDQGFCIIKVLFDEQQRPIDYRFLEVNHVFETVTGLHNVLGKRIRELAPTHEQRWFDIYGAIAKTGMPRRFEDHASALGRWYEVYALRVADPALHHVAVLFKDITAAHDAASERERTLRLEQAARQDAENASRMKDEFLATISHELRTPLNAIVGWASLMADPRSDAATLSEGVEAIQRNAQSQAQLIEDLLDVSRIISGKLRLNPTTIDLCDVLQAAMETVEMAAHAKHIELRLSCQEGSLIIGDRDRLQQVFWNLVSNAIKFTDRQGHISVTLRRTEHRVFVSISDTGKGIDSDFLPHVFDRFRQADMKTTRRAGGLGLGLSIVRQIVELHGGNITAHSEGPGKGSTFNVELPVALPSDAPAPASHAHERIETGDVIECPPNLAGQHALILDDEPDARRVLEAILLRCNMKVTAASNVADAMNLLSDGKHFTLIVSDLGMPDADGYEFIRRFRGMERERQKRRLPVVALTAYARAQDEHRALSAGFDAFLTKPIRRAVLLETLSTLVRPGRPPEPA